LRVFRIAGAAYPVFAGEGARRYGGRWNTAGRPVIYCGDSFALAMLEILVHTATGRDPRRDRWISAEIPDDGVEALDPAALDGWDADPPVASRHFGDRWLAEGRSLALSVPSVVTRIDRNVVLNPAHPRFGEVAVSGERPVSWDRRLFARREWPR
jgi:RES domain-containing protein